MESSKDITLLLSHGMISKYPRRVVNEVPTIGYAIRMPAG